MAKIVCPICKRTIQESLAELQKQKYVQCNCGEILSNPFYDGVSDEIDSKRSYIG